MEGGDRTVEQGKERGGGRDREMEGGRQNCRAREREREMEGGRQNCRARERERGRQRQGDGRRETEL